MPSDGKGVIRNLNGVYYRNRKNARGEIETPHITIDSKTSSPDKAYFVIYCARCHAGLCGEMTIGRSLVKRENIILIEPCPYCMGEREENAVGG